jgi:glycosyltransferase involved in cell wall biosynthesis
MAKTSTAGNLLQALHDAGGGRARVLLVHNRYQQPGGEDTAMQMEMQMLESAGHELGTYVRSNDEVRTYNISGNAALPLKTIWAWDSRRDLCSLLKREQPDVAHFHNTFPLVSPSAYYACREAHVPVIQTLHNYRLLCPAGTFYRNGKICEECLHGSVFTSALYGCYRHSRAASATTALMLRVHRTLGTWTELVDVYIALTEFARQKFIAGGLPAERIMVKPNFVQTDPGAKGPSGEYAVFVGRLSPEKGIRTLLAAWKHLKTRIPLRVIGDGPLKQELTAAAERQHLSDVTFEGRLSREETLAALKGARFLVFPSEWYEGFPMTIAESFACGTPVLFSGMDSLREIVADGRTGVQFVPGDASDLAAKVEWAWSHAPLIEEMGREARYEYESKYTAEHNYVQLMEIYRRATVRAQAVN